jgi:ferredoxin
VTATWVAIRNAWEVVCDGCGLSAGFCPTEAVPRASLPVGWAVITYSDGGPAEHYCDDCVERSRKT